MKMKILAALVFGLTVVVVTLYPWMNGLSAVNPPKVPPTQQSQPKRSKIEVVFVLDTTGSMGGLIAAAKEKIWSIANSMASAETQTDIRMGLIAYRDRGDDYVTKVVDLSEDLDTMYATLMDFQANGGGDGPESVNQALYDAIHKVSWSDAQKDVYRVIFLVGDAPAHMDYPDDVKFPESLGLAAKKGIIVNAIQCGESSETTAEWQQIAQLGYGKYFQVEQSGNAVAVKTPYDEKLAELSAGLDSTRLYYGSPEEKAEKAKKIQATEKLHAAASVESKARRAAFNATKSGGANSFGKGDVVDDVSSGRVALEKIDRDKLPEPMQAMPAAQQQALIQEKAEQRRKLKGEMQELAGKRADFLKKHLEASGEAKDSLDRQLFDVVREQAGRKGLVYSSKAEPAY